MLHSYPYFDSCEHYRKILKNKTDVEHVLKRPDSYTGSFKKTTEVLYVVKINDKTWNRLKNHDTDDDSDNEIAKNDSIEMIRKPTTFSPALFKIFDEILINASDNGQRDSSMTTLKVDIDLKKGSISVWNDGKGLPVEIHKKAKLYVPELIFGEMRTSSNFDDDEKRTTGGRNGYGAKLTNILSSQFTIKTYDSERGLLYTQLWENNMKIKHPPVISKKSGTDFTCVTFVPDYKLFDMKQLDRDAFSLISRRVYDIAGTTKNSIAVYLNGVKLQVKSFPDYCRVFLNSSLSNKEEKEQEKSTIPFLYERVNERWEVCVSMTDGDAFESMSFVNGISTLKGGTHVNAVMDQLISPITKKIMKKLKTEAFKPQLIRNHLFVFINALIENPGFDTQTKTTLTTPKRDFGSECILSEKFMKKLLKSDIVTNILATVQQKVAKTLFAKSNGKKVTNLSIPKLDDAREAGGKLSQKCTIIFTEGDSAKALAMAGLSVVGRQFYGVFPLRGKVVNVRDSLAETIEKNLEFRNIKKILGLKNDVDYKDTKSLRYGHVMIMTDQDHDGSHIKGLIINMFEYYWPGLLKIDGFMQEFITPIIKATRPNISKKKGAMQQSKKKKQNPLTFYNTPSYQRWKSENNDGKGWTLKYYKGLGTSTSTEAKEYFGQLKKHKVTFEWNGTEDHDALVLAFSKKKADARKQWMEQHDPENYLEHSEFNTLSYTDFVNKELILFSIACNERAIPSLVDGFKPGQRKILYAGLKRGLVREIKVASLAGYVIDTTAYHHGEASLWGTIIMMAQTYVGSNNINLLVPSGQFGTRAELGDDAASPRYINTCLSKFVRSLFSVYDDPLLIPQTDDGQKIEPKYYLPILPMVLVNGAKGIGMGWSTTIPSYNPRDLIENLRRLLSKKSILRMKPWFRGFRGNIRYKRKSDKYELRGIVKEIDSTTIEICEIPLNKSLTNYKEFLTKLKLAEAISKWEDESTEDQVSITVYFEDEKQMEVARTWKKHGFLDKFQLIQSLNLTNLVAFSSSDHLHKYASAEDMLSEFFNFRLPFYALRKDSMVSILRKDLNRLSNRMRFVLEVIHETLVLRNVPRKQLLKQLSAKKYDLLPPSSSKKRSPNQHDDNDEEEEEDKEEEEKKEEKKDKEERELIPIESNLRLGYEYLLSMPLWSLTYEKVEELKREHSEKESELNVILRVSPEEMWKRDLDILEEAWTLDMQESTLFNNDVSSLVEPLSENAQEIKSAPFSSSSASSMINVRLSIFWFSFLNLFLFMYKLLCLLMARRLKVQMMMSRIQTKRR
jgi:DNA topoisomerase II